MIPKFRILLFVVCATLSGYDIVAQSYPGTNLRGKVVTTDYYQQQVPLTYTNVDLYWFNSETQNWELLQNTLTDDYGFFYFNHVIPYRTYSIQINGNQNYTISVDRIDYSLYQYQDLPVLIY